MDSISLFFLSSGYKTSYAILALFTVSFVILCQISLKMLSHRDKSSKSNIPPGSRGLPFIGETLEFMAALKSNNGFYDFVRIRRARYGNCFKTNIFGGTHVFVSSTSSAKVILNNESGNFTKRYIKSVAELIGHKSILCAPKQHHKIVRGRLSNLVSSTNLTSFVNQFDQLIVRSLGTWENKSSTVVVLDEALKIVGEAMCKMLMSLESGHKLETLSNEVSLLCKALLSVPIRLPCTRFSKGLQARKKIMRLLENEMIQRRRGHVGPHDDLLERLMDLDDKLSYDSANRHQLDDEEIKDNILTVIIAGQDTTASAITWMVKFLDENPDVLNQLRKEHLKLAREKSTNESLTLEDLNNMTYASKVVKESLRKASIVAWFPRLVLNDCEIEGYGIEKGWSVNIDARQVHHDPNVYKDPYAFNPSRFEDDSKPYSFLAFGMGARTCLGINMAKAMMLVFLHRLITTYRWKVTDPDSSVEKMAMFSRLRSGCPMIVKRITSDDDHVGDIN